MAGRALAALALLTALAVAQEHAYEPDAAWLAHATEKWLVWVPDDKGASLDPPAEEDEETTEPGAGDGGPDIKKLPTPPKLPKLDSPLADRTVYVLQSTADPKQRRKIVVEWKGVLERPIGLRPVTVRDDGTLVLAGLKRNEIILCWPGGGTSRVPLLARDNLAVLVAAYPDGVVLQTPPPDDVAPKGPEPRLKRAVLYWAAWGRYGLESEKAQRMSFHEGATTAFGLHVARFGDDVAMPGGVYSPGRKRRQRFRSENAMSIYAFDGRVALGRVFAYSVRESDNCGMVDDHEYFLAHDGIGYWLERGDGSALAIRACRLRDRKKVLSVGHVRFWGEYLSPPDDVLGSTLAAEDVFSKTRFTIYWTKDGLRWTEEGCWQSKAWLQEADFK